MRRSKSMSPKVEGLESLVFLSVAVPVAAAEVDTAARSSQAVTTDELPIITTGTNDPAEQGGEVVPISAPARPAPGQAARPLPPEVVRPISANAGEALAGPMARQFAGPTARTIADPSLDLANLDLSSTARGNYRLQLAPDGSSGSFQLQGIGQVLGLGPTRISADYAADQSSAPETFIMTLNTRRGNLMLEVGRAPGDVDPDMSTARLRYQVVNATGALAGANDSGILDMTLRPQMRTLGATGQMTLTLRSQRA